MTEFIETVDITALPRCVTSAKGHHYKPTAPNPERKTGGFLKNPMNRETFSDSCDEYTCDFRIPVDKLLEIAVTAKQDGATVVYLSYDVTNDDDSIYVEVDLGLHLEYEEDFPKYVEKWNEIAAEFNEKAEAYKKICEDPQTVVRYQ